MNVYYMDFKKLSRLQSMGKDVRCRWCEKPIVIGDQVVSGNTKSYKIYHFECYEALHYDVSDENGNEIEEVAMVAV